jgi:serine/threonine protein kinase
LDAWKGEDLSVLAEYVGESDVETMLLRWAAELCEALEVLHAQGWVHGDVSPSNILVDEGDVLLIDYDLAGPAGTIAATPGTMLYASSERRRNAPMRPVDDVFALAASLFHIATGRPPFSATGVPGALIWSDSERQRWPRLVEFLDTATNPEGSRRFETAGAAARMLRVNAAGELDARLIVSEPAPMSPNVVPRVRDILQAVGNLWVRIYRIAKTEFPELKMDPPGEKGAQSKWLIFKADLPPRVTIDWKITKATMDLSFWKGAKNAPTQPISLSSLPPGVTLGRLGETTAISVPLSRPPSDWTQMADDEIRAGLGTACKLLRFYGENLA